MKLEKKTEDLQFLDFETLWDRCSPKARIMRCGGISGTAEAPHMREILISIDRFIRISLKSDGTYTVQAPGQLI